MSTPGDVRTPHDAALHVDFRSPTLPDALQWFCEPPRWRIDSGAGRLVVASAAGTDFWQRTHYGFRPDNGHALLMTVPAARDFTLSTRVQFRARHQYDQAGLMLRVSADDWLKTSIEYEPHGACRLGAVVTQRGWSDWSTQDVSNEVRAVSLRIVVRAHDCLVEASLDGSSWSQIRLAHLGALDGAATLECGLYLCSPKEDGFEAAFEHLDYAPS